MTRLAFRVGLLLVWCLSMAWLIRFEAYPEAFTHAIPGYKGLLSSDLLLSDSWMKVLVNGKPVGYMHATLDTDDQNALRHYQIQNQMMLALNLMGERRDIRMDSLVALDLTRTLQYFDVKLETGFLADISIRGIRQQGSRFLLTLSTGTNATRTTVDIPDDVVLYSPVSTLIAKTMKPGDHLTVKTLDPFTRGSTSVTLEAIRRETITLGEEQVQALLLRTRHQGMELDSWVGEGGDILRQVLPAGITIEKTTPENALAAYLDADVTTDILPDIIQVLGKRP